MIDNSVEYLYNQTVLGSINKDLLSVEIGQSSISQNLENIIQNEESFFLVFNQALTDLEKDELDNIISAHSSSTTKQLVQAIITNAMIFGQNVMVEFATENVMMGITQAGKTAAVVNYLQDCMRYAQSGSLYEILTSVDTKIAEGIPENLAPFVTEARLLEFKQKVQTYLGIP